MNGLKIMYDITELYTPGAKANDGICCDGIPERTNTKTKMDENKPEEN